jgi:hypothetical protein
MIIPLALEDGSTRHAFLEAITGLDETALRVVHLAISRAVALQSAGREADADAMLLGLLRLMDKEAAGEGPLRAHSSP